MRGAGNACGWSAESVLTPSLISYGNACKSPTSAVLAPSRMAAMVFILPLAATPPAASISWSEHS